METLEFIQEFSLDIMFLCIDALMVAFTVWLVKKMFFNGKPNAGWYK